MEGLVSEGTLERSKSIFTPVPRGLLSAAGCRLHCKSAVCATSTSTSTHIVLCIPYPIFIASAGRRWLLVCILRLVSAASRTSRLESLRTEDMLRQQKEGASASAAAEALRPLDCDEQEKVLGTIAQEARRQMAFFTVSG